MAIRTTTPIEKDGRIYDRLAINMAFSPMWREDGVGCSVAMRLVPYCKDAERFDRLEDQAQAVVFGDVVQEAQSDPDVLACALALEAALQAFVTAKGL